MEYVKPCVKGSATLAYNLPTVVARRRVNVNFSEQAYRALEDLSTHTGKSMSEVLRDAIALKVWFHETLAQGNRVLVEKPNGSIREVLSV